MIKRIWAIFRVMILKLKYGKRLTLNKKFYNNYFESIRNVSMIDGSIKIKGNIHMKFGSRFGVNKGGRIIVGSGCFFNTNTICASLGKIIIGDYASFGPNVCLYDHDHSFDENGKMLDSYKIGKITIGNNVWIGAGSIILRDTVIGDNCVIGAGTIVKGKIPANSLVTNDRKLVVSKLSKNRGNKHETNRIKK